MKILASLIILLHILRTWFSSSEEPAVCLFREPAPLLTFPLLIPRRREIFTLLRFGWLLPLWGCRMYLLLKILILYHATEIKIYLCILNDLYTKDKESIHWINVCYFQNVDINYNNTVKSLFPCDISLTP